MGSWYWIGVAVGIGVSLGVFAAAFWGTGRTATYVVPVVAVGVAAAIGQFISDSEPGRWGDWTGASVGAVLGLLGAVPVVVGALRRGGARAGTVVLLAGTGLVLAGLAFVPAAGYLEAVVLPALAALLRRRRPERYAGLRTLAKD